jgi:arabinofuranan 3-O-arabinosyltransferase
MTSSARSRVSRPTRVLLALTTGLAIGLLFSQVRAAWTDVQATDFRVFYESGRSWLTGADLYATSARLPNLNPPQFIVAFATLSWLPIKQALAVWLFLNIACGIVSFAIIFRELEIPRSLVTLQAAVAAAGLCTGVLVALETAQITGVLMLLITTAWSLSRRGSWKACGVILGLVISIKPFFGCFLLIPLLRRQFAALACAAVVAGAAIGTGVAFAGPLSLQRWIETGRLVTWFQHPANASLLGLMARAGMTSWPVWLLLSVAGVILSVALVRRSRTLDVEWATFGLLSILVSPLGWVYYMPVVAGPVVAVALARPAIMYALVGFVWPIPLVAVIMPATRWSFLSVGSLQTWSLIALWAALVAMRDNWEVPEAHAQRRVTIIRELASS